MACRRCSTCGINYPLGNADCKVCEAALDYIGNEDEDVDWEEAVQLKVAEPSRRELDMIAYRRRVLAKAGFEDVNLEMLASRETDLRLAEKLIADGCPHDTALRILT